MAERERFELSRRNKPPNGFRDRRIQPLCHLSKTGCAGKTFWRRVGDLNPGDALDAYTISNRAPSATRTTLHSMRLVSIY